MSAIEQGADPSWFPDPAGSQVTVVPNPRGDGYLCPAFDPATSHCRLYDARPLDCQLYPLAMMWNVEHDQVVLGWDVKCPFLREQVPVEIRTFADRMAIRLEQEETLAVLERHPRLIGRFQEDVVVLRELPRLTVRVGRETLEVKRETQEAINHAPSVRSRASSPVTPHPLTLADRPRFEEACAASAWFDTTPLAASSFAYHYMWQSLLSYWWIELDSHLCLFAESPDGLFLAVPPLGGGPVTQALAEAFGMMQERNRNRPVTRVENVPTGLQAELEQAGYRHTSKDGDYLYRATDLVSLTGDRYKSQRGACNRFEREHDGCLESYEDRDQDACRSLFRDWQSHKLAVGIEESARWMLADSETAHREALAHHKALGLTGAVARVNGAIRAYTFGFWLTPAVFCVLLEVADRTIPGLAQFVFRECCRFAQLHGAEFINTMDDSGLATLAQSKRAYHPIELIPNWIATT